MMPHNSKQGLSRRALLAGAAAGTLPMRRAFAQSAEPLKIGFLTVDTGPLAAGGKQQEEGAALFLQERGGLIAGRKVELIKQDTGGNTSLARTKTQELVERYKVPMMIGPLATNEALAMDSYIRDAKAPLITTTSAATVDLKARLDEYGTPILDIYIRKVARVNGKLENTILKTYRQVGQFWTYKAAEFVTQPPFSRDYPPSKNLE